MTGQTSVPAAINGIYDLFVGALSGPKPLVTVYYGPTPVTDPPRTFVVVAYSEDENQSAVQGSTDRYAGEGTPQEDFTVACYISTWGGDANDLRTKMAETSSVYDLLTAAIRSDRTLMGAVKPPGLAEIGGFSWVLDQLEDGSVVEVAFEVKVNTAVLW